MKWTIKEIALLKSVYSNSTWKQVKKLFPNRTKRSIDAKAREIGLSRAKYTIKGGLYYVYAYCIIHGKIYKEEIAYKKGKACCPRDGCNRLLRMLPKKSKLREKYRRKENEG